MIPQPPRLAVITVHYGDPRITTDALTALWHSSRPPDRVIIIDHARQPLSLPSHPNQQTIRPAGNAGYAAGLNIGLGMVFSAKPADEDIVVCMNNDALVSPHTLARVLEYCHRAAQPALVGARWGVVNPLTGRAHLTSPSSRAPHPSSLSYIDGAFFTAPWSVFRRLKKIPDDYFMYWEESVLNYHLQRLGIPRHVIPDLDIQHDDTKPSTQSDQQTYFLVRNGAHFLQTYTPWPLRLWWWNYNRLRYVYHLGRGHRSSRIRQALKDAMKGPPWIV